MPDDLIRLPQPVPQYAVDGGPDRVVCASASISSRPRLRRRSPPEAPERIWIDPQDDGAWYREQASVDPEGEVEYVRADLAQPPVAAPSAMEAWQLREALESIRHDIAAISGAYATDIHPENRAALTENGHQNEWQVDMTDALRRIDAILSPGLVVPARQTTPVVSRDAGADDMQRGSELRGRDRERDAARDDDAMTAPDEIERIARGLTKAQRRCLLALSEHSDFVSYRDGGYTASAANLIDATWRCRPLVARCWRGDAFRYRLTPLGRAVAAYIREQGETHG